MKAKKIRLNQCRLAEISVQKLLHYSCPFGLSKLLWVRGRAVVCLGVVLRLAIVWVTPESPHAATYPHVVQLVNNGT